MASVVSTSAGRRIGGTGVPVASSRWPDRLRSVATVPGAAHPSRRLGEIALIGCEQVPVREVAQLLESRRGIASDRAAELFETQRAKPDRAGVLLRLVVAAVHQALVRDAMLDAKHV